MPDCLLSLPNHDRSSLLIGYHIAASSSFNYNNVSFSYGFCAHPPRQCDLRLFSTEYAFFIYQCMGVRG